jgi:serpin B
MIILAPDNGDVNGLINQLKNRDFAELIEAADGDNYANVSLTMPKFSIQSTTSLISGLRELGIRDLFSQHAQLPFVSTKENVQVSDVQQQSKLEVNEKGTIAASITTFSVVALSYSPPLPNVNILVNKPFLAIVVEKANKIPLFISKISRPE